MPLQIQWYIPYKVIDEQIWGKVTIEEIQQQIDLWVDMLNKAQVHAPEKKVYLLFDDTNVEKMPPAYLMIPQALPVLKFQNRGPMFHITHKRPISNIIEIAAHVMGFEIRTFTVREEAIRELEITLMREVQKH
jgi:hypothetical protein